MDRELNWAVVGTGTLANQMAAAFSERGKRLSGVTCRTYEKAESYALKYGVSKAYKSVGELASDPDVDIVYVATPNNTHYALIKQCLEAGKHVLAEKSIVLNVSELKSLMALAERRGLILAEAQTIYHMPLYKEFVRMRRSGELGKARVITANFGSFKNYDPDNRFFSKDLGGGALLDIGVYALSAVRMFLDSDPDKVFSVMVPADTGTDDLSAIALANGSGQVATVALSMHSKQPKRFMVSFGKAYAEIPDYPRADVAYITDAETGETRQIIAGERSKALLYEIEDMELAVRSGDSSIMLPQYTLSVMDTMTAVRKEWGLEYPEEKDE